MDNLIYASGKGSKVQIKVRKYYHKGDRIFSDIKETFFSHFSTSEIGMNLTVKICKSIIDSEFYNP